jgi:tryptophan halogenase
MRAEYNRWMQRDFEQVRDFLVLHYYANERGDEPFWNYCRNMHLPETLQRRLALFREGGRFLRFEGELFSNASWVAVMLGQNIIPNSIDPAVAAMPSGEVKGKLELLRTAMNAFVATLRTHEDVLRQYCPAGSG